MPRKDKWDDLPNVVAQLQAEAKSAPPRARRPSVPPRDATPSPESTPPREAAPVADRAAPARDAWAERLTADDDRTILRARAVAAAAGAAAAPATPPAPEPLDDSDDDSDAADEDTTWPGIADYDALAGATSPDPRALLKRLADETERALGERAKVMRPLITRLERQLDALGKPPTQEQLSAFTRALDKLEDLFAALMEMR
jgi:hypothetical protein